jgi:hypothetical protein
MGSDNVTYVQYDKKYFAGIKTKEHFSESTFTSEIIKHDKWILFVDSKSKGAVLRQELMEMKKLIDPEGKLPITVIDSDFNGEMTLDIYSMVICSPSVIYGLDSHVERAVFCFYRSHTICPKAMGQQCGRERKITALHYLFTNKGVKTPVYETLEQARDQIEERWSLNKKGSLPKDILSWRHERCSHENFYYEMLAEYMYLDACYSSNKFLHFREILRSKGMVVEVGKYNKTTVNAKKRDDAMKELDKQEKMKRLPEFVAI